jgi:hypothetical protein
VLPSELIKRQRKPRIVGTTVLLTFAAVLVVLALRRGCRHLLAQLSG